jgi:F-type H+-transporting ATPase subunit gamma
MASLKEIRIRIASVSSTRQITSAMKMVSAAKLRKAQDAVLQLRPYAEKLQEILSTISSSSETDEGNPYAVDRGKDKVLVVVVTSNRGLCGAFNTNVIKTALQVAWEKYPNQLNSKKLYFMPIGKKAYDFFTKKQYLVLEGSYNEVLDGTTFDKVAPVAQKVMDLYLQKEFDRVIIVYNQFKNAAVQITQTEQFLPIKKTEAQSKSKAAKAINNDFIFEPTKEIIVNELIPKSLRMSFYKSVIDSVASEHGARMTAMHKATDNASDIIRDLKLLYNKARQASITNEILEIVSGANALKG